MAPLWEDSPCLVPANIMGLIDAIKRWRLANKGLSSGKKRRTQRDTGVTIMIDRSRWFRWLLYMLFVAIAALFVANGSHLSIYAEDETTRILAGGLFGFAAVVMHDLIHNHRARNGRVVLVFGGMCLYLLALWVTQNLVFGKYGTEEFKLLLTPFVLVPMVNSILLGRRAGMFSMVFAALIGSLMVPRDLVPVYFTMMLLGGLTCIYLTKSVRRRGAVLRAGFYAGVAVLIVGILFDLVTIPESHVDWKQTLVAGGGAIGMSLLVSMVVSGVLPVLETSFGITTDISWLESSDLNNKLLKRMQLEAPGTFHHSLVVASLAESAAESVGANAIMCRVCSYFHDIGKMKKPEYFIENQGEENPHDQLTPTMSALIIIAHVKDGVDMAMKFKLNPVIIDVIREHHGDSLVAYFYHKAREQQKEQLETGQENHEDFPEINEKSFRYPGPKPRSKESGIISLADAIESASRTIHKPSPAKISALVNDIVTKRILEGQLDESGLTMNELCRVKESFSSTLRSMMHSRIDYPKEENAAERRKEKQSRASNVKRGDSSKSVKKQTKQAQPNQGAQSTKSQPSKKLSAEKKRSTSGKPSKGGKPSSDKKAENDNGSS